MSNWNEVRSLARQWHHELIAAAGLVPAQTLIDAARQASGVTLLRLPAGDILLDGAEAAYDPDGPRIVYSTGLASDLARFFIAHEFAHHRLHDLKSSCQDDELDPWTPAEPEGSAVGEDDAYSPKQRREAQANLFAREFLVPRDKLRLRATSERIAARTLAVELGLPENLILQQMADALLLPDDPPVAPRREEPPPDDSQLEAITAGMGPHQVRAGPGTGKTRTLVSRVAHIIGAGKDPASSILALTYSNESARDLALRIRAGVGDPSAAVWTGTFHAFGLELLRRYWAEIGPNEVPQPLDRSEALFLLEEFLPELDLNFYLDLHEPLRALKAVLGAIGRAKDELCPPERYLALARDMASRATNASEREAAAKAEEVAHVYELYDRKLRDRGMVDFGDLILRSVELLRSRADIATQIRTEFKHVLVDEYQDMNHASGALLRELVGPDGGPWVVGDVRQSIYRFRGASPLNMSRFVERFPGATATELKVNYRSGGKIVRTFEAFGRSMPSASLSSAEPLSPDRGADTGVVEFSIAVDRDAEYEGIAKRIVGHTTAGMSLRDNAVLARSHSTLVRLASHLERAGIPTLYFGDFFERPEVRDLLSLLSVVSEWDGLGLIRVGQWSRYGIPVPDILATLEWVTAKKTTLLALLSRAEAIEGLSSDGLAGLRRLSADVDGVSFGTSPHKFLADFLFNQGGVHDLPLAERTVAGEQRRLAIYQLLQVTYEQRRHARRDPKREFLEHVRRLEILDEEKDLRKLPAAAAGIEAVRLMTIHSSKGLEYPVVHIPSLSPSLFPPNGRNEPCPPPVGMVESDPLMSTDAEEQSLFFVGLSRARDVLSLSRADAYGGWPRPKPSSLLMPIADLLPHDTGVRLSDRGRTADVYPPLAQERPIAEEISVQSVETYQKCPRKFYYEHVLGLRSRTIRGPYLRFISAIRSGLKWLRETPAGERAQGIDAQFAVSWDEVGPTDSAHAEVYRATARRMIDTAVKVMDGASLVAERSMPVGTRKVLALADNIQIKDGRVVIQRLKAGRLAKKETERTRDQLLRAMVAIDHPNEQVEFEHISLLTGDRVAASFKSDGRAAVDQVFEGVAAGRFDPKQSDRDCPTCPYYFVCPSAGTTL